MKKIKLSKFEWQDIDEMICEDYVIDIVTFICEDKICAVLYGQGGQQKVVIDEWKYSEVYAREAYTLMDWKKSEWGFILKDDIKCLEQKMKKVF